MNTQRRRTSNSQSLCTPDRHTIIMEHHSGAPTFVKIQTHHQINMFSTPNLLLWCENMMICSWETLGWWRRSPVCLCCVTPPPSGQMRNCKLTWHIILLHSWSKYRILNGTSVRVNNNNTIWTVNLCVYHCTTGFQLRKMCQRVASPASDVDMWLVWKVVEDTIVSRDTYSVISLWFHIYPSQRHTTDLIFFPSRFPPAYDSQRWVHAFAFMDTLQQSWAPPREETPQWLGHPRPLNETGEAEVAVTFNVKEGEGERPEAAGAGRHRTERPPVTPEPFMVLHKHAQRDVLRADGVEMCNTAAFLLLSLCFPLFYT